MGFKESIKDLYLKLEDYYYTFLEKTGLYKLVDPLEAKGIRSFPIALGLVAVILVLLVAGFYSLLGLGKVSVTVTVLDLGDFPIAGAQVTYEGDSVYTDVEGMATVKVKKGEVFLDIDAEGYQYKSHSIIAVAGLEETIYMEIELLDLPTDVTLYLKSSDGSTLSGENIHLDFMCTSGTQAPDALDTTEWFVTVTKPSGCGVLMVEGTVAGFEEGSWPLRTSSEVIQFARVEPPQGEVLATVTANDNPLSGIEVVLVASGEEIAYSSTNDSGVATFRSVTAGNYDFVASDPLGVYASSSTGATISEGSNSVYIDLSKAPIGNIKVRVMDENGPVDTASVVLYSAVDSGDVKANRRMGSAKPTEGVASFAITENIEYYVTVSEPKYMAVVKTGVTLAKYGVSPLDVMLEPCTQSTCASIVVRATTTEGKPVQGAIVYLYESQTNNKVNNLGNPTGMDGSASFLNIPEGSYYAKVYKSILATSDSAYVAAGAIEVLSVVMEIGEGAVQFKVTDRDGLPIPFASVGFYSGLTREKMIETEADGEGVLTPRSFTAGEKVYAVVSAEGYATYITAPLDVLIGQITSKEVALRKYDPLVDVRDIPSISFMGTYFEGKRLERVSGEIFDKILELKYEIFVPQAYEEVKAMVRVGFDSSPNIEFDPVVIKDSSVAEAFVMKSSTWTPPIGDENDLGAGLTTADAKWVLADFDSPRVGTYEMIVQVKLNELASDLPSETHYRVEAKKADKTLRNPTDEVLGTNESTDAKHALYANTHDRDIIMGVISLCDDEAGFCYTLKIEDLVEGIETTIVSERERYPAIVNAGYILKVNLSNTGILTRTDSTLTVYELNSRVLDFERYSVIDPLTQEKFGEPLTNRFDEYLGDIAPNALSSFELRFKPKSSSNTIIRFEVKSGKEIVFSRNIAIDVSEGKNMMLEVLPEIINSATDTILNINVTEPRAGAAFPIGKVKLDVTINDDFPPYATIFTDFEGDASLVLVKQLPETKVAVTASKEKYLTASKAIIVDANLLTPIPDVIEPLFIVGGDREKKVLVDLTNNTGMDFVIVGMQVTGNTLMKQFIDWDPEDYTRYNGITILRGQRAQAEVVLSMKKGIVGVPRGEITGSVDIRLLDPASGHEFVTKIPVKPSLRKITAVPGEGCIIVEVKEGEWRFSSLGDPVQKEIIITNMCEDKATGVGIEVQNLGASLAWDRRKKIGDVKLMIDAIAPILRERPRSVKALLQYNEPIVAILEYRPMAGKAVEGSAQLTLTGDVETEEGFKELPATVIGLDFSYNNLKKCIKFQGVDKVFKRVEIERVGEYGRITVDASDCDLTTQTIGVRMVAPLEGTDIRPDTYFVLDSETPSQELRVGSRTYAGIMPVFVDLLPGEDESQAARMVDPIEILVERNTALQDSFILDKFEYNIDVAPDYGEIIEKRFWKTIEIELARSEVDSFADFLISTVLASVGAGAGLGAGVAALGSSPVGAVVGLIVGIGLLIYLIWDFFHSYVDVETPAYPMEEMISTANNLDVIIIPDDTYGFEYITDDPVPADYDYGRFRGIKFYDDPDYEGINYGILTLEGRKYTYETEEVDDAPEEESHCHAGETCVGDRCVGYEFCDYHFDLHAKDKLPIASSYYIKVEGDVQPYRKDFENLDAEFCYGANGEQGITGYDAAPKIDYDWQWKSIPYNFCEPEEEGGFAYYCDATQFSIALIKRLHVLEQFLKQNDLQCPLTSEDLSELIEEAGADWDPPATTDYPQMGAQPPQGDIGIIRPIERTTSGENLSIINAHIMNNLGASVTGIVTTTIKADNQDIPDVNCVETRTFPVGSTETVSCYKTLDRQENYTATVTLDLRGASCPDNDCGSTTNDSASVRFTLYGAQQSDCLVPLTLGTIGAFIEDTPDVRYSLDLEPEFSSMEIYSAEDVYLKMLSFKAFLMPDDLEGAGGDFRADFDQYYSYETLEGPEYYTSGMVGLRNYFVDPSKLQIINKYTTGGRSDPLRARIGSPGLYEIIINPRLEKGYNRLFSGGAPTGTIEVTFNKINSPDVDTAFYYLPFNGYIGREKAADGTVVLNRDGYGIDFSPDGDTVAISDELTEFITELPPAMDRVRALYPVKARTELDFAKLNQVTGGSGDERGKVLRMKPGREGKEHEITFYPTFAVPLMVQMNEATNLKYFVREGLSDEDAKGVDKGPSEWLAIGAKDCSAIKDFEKLEVNESGSKGNYSVSTKPTYPDLYLKTMMYVPAGAATNYYLGNSDAQSPAKLVLSNGIPQNQVSLSGMPANIPVIGSLEEVFDNIRSRNICMYSKPDGTNLFFWNPRVLYGALHEATIPLAGMELCDVCGDYVCEGEEFFDCPDDCATDLSNFSRAHPNINRIENTPPS